MFCVNPDTGQIDASLLCEEVFRAEEFRRKHTARAREIIRRYIGNWYRIDAACDPTPENLVASYIAFMLPELSYAAPSARIEAKRPTKYGDIADAMEQGMHAWLQEFEFTEEHQEVTRDFLINFGVMKVGMERRDNRPDGPRRTEALLPFACRVPVDQFIMDPRCEAPRYARMLGHKYWKDLDVIQAEEDRWDQEAVARLTSMVEEQTSPAESFGAGQERAVNLGMSTDRNRVMLADVWIPELNRLVTLAMSGTKEPSDLLLRNVEYHGPLSGPYEVFGAYTVPGDPYPISPLQMAMEQFEDLQQHLATAAEAASTFKRFVIVDAAANDLQAAALNAMNGSVLPVRGFNAQNMMQIELGGPHSEQSAYTEKSRDRFDRTIGMSDAQRGRVQGKTATETQITQSNVDGRTQFLKSRITNSTRRVLEKVGWYLFYNPNVVMDVTRTDPSSGQQTEGLFLGGIQPGQDEVDWVHFNLTIVPKSMELTDDTVQQQHAMALVQFAPQAAQGMLTMPFINWRWLVDMLGESMNIKKLSGILFNQQMMQQLQQTAQAFGMGGAPMPQGVNPQLVQMLLGAIAPQQNQPVMPGGQSIPGKPAGGSGGFPQLGGSGSAPNAAGAAGPSMGQRFSTNGFAKPARAAM